MPIGNHKLKATTNVNCYLERAAAFEICARHHPLVGHWHMEISFLFRKLFGRQEESTPTPFKQGWPKPICTDMERDAKGWGHFTLHT